jgi:uroporphyrinogen III methyltransferase / synthase
VTPSGSGSVHLVGAGPGAPDLITERGRARLGVADVVVHDRLVSPRLLDHAPAHALIIDAGKPSRLPRLTHPPHTALDPQPVICGLLIDHARQGKVVVRLKGGDPFVFGRGSEEVDACRAAGIPCEVVPGVSSALAAPAAAGIPVTERGVARGFTVRTARLGDGGGVPARDPHDVSFGADTQVVLMGVETLAQVATQAIAAGRATDTPAAVIASATLPREQVVFAPLVDIARVAARAGVEAPAVLVFGEVVRRAAHRFDGRLPGRPRVALTRPQGAARRTEAHLAARGFDVVAAPLLSIESIAPRELAAPLGKWLDRPTGAAGSWLAFTSRHGVEGWWQAVVALGRDARAFADTRFAVVGPGTAAALAEHGLVADLVATPHRAAALVEQLAAAARATGDGTVRFASGTRARRELVDGLVAAGLAVDELPVYRTRLEAPPDAFRRALEQGVDAVVFASPSAAESFAVHQLPTGDATAVCLGPTTARVVRGLGFERVEVADRHDEPGLVEEIVRALAADRTNLRTAGVRS